MDKHLLSFSIILAAILYTLVNRTEITSLKDGESEIKWGNKRISYGFNHYKHDKLTDTYYYWSTKEKKWNKFGG